MKKYNGAGRRLTDEELLGIIKKKAARHVARAKPEPANFQVNLFRTDAWVDSPPANPAIPDKSPGAKRHGLFVNLFKTLKGRNSLRRME